MIYLSAWTIWNRTMSCLISYQGNKLKVQGIPKKVFVRKISALKAKKYIRKGCKLFAVNIRDIEYEREKCTEYFPVLEEFKDVFPEEILGLPPKQDLEIFHRTDPMISSGLQIPLPHKCT